MQNKTKTGSSLKNKRKRETKVAYPIVSHDAQRREESERERERERKNGVERNKWISISLVGNDQIWREMRRRTRPCESSSISLLFLSLHFPFSSPSSFVFFFVY